MYGKFLYQGLRQTTNSDISMKIVIRSIRRDIELPVSRYIYSFVWNRTELKLLDPIKEVFAWSIMMSITGYEWQVPYAPS